MFVLIYVSNTLAAPPPFILKECGKNTFVPKINPSKFTTENWLKRFKFSNRDSMFLEGVERLEEVGKPTLRQDYAGFFLSTIV